MFAVCTLAHTPPTTGTHRIAFASPSQPSVHRTGIPQVNQVASPQRHTYHGASGTMSYIRIYTQYAQYKFNGKRAQEGTGGQPPDPRSCGGPRPILMIKALHYPPVRIIRTTT